MWGLVLAGGLLLVACSWLLPGVLFVGFRFGVYAYTFSVPLCGGRFLCPAVCFVFCGGGFSEVLSFGVLTLPDFCGIIVS